MHKTTILIVIKSVEPLSDEDMMEMKETFYNDLATDQDVIEAEIEVTREVLA